ncbi:MAG: hypothetical protein IPM69_16430 [Ignavibacteria bacterium]|nr:hypothetical protein [Ignavibacteria bacterium]
MWNDEIVEEVRKSREAHAKKCDNNLQSIVADLQLQQRMDGRAVVSFISQNPQHENADLQESEK